MVDEPAQSPHGGTLVPVAHEKSGIKRNAHGAGKCGGPAVPIRAAAREQRAGSPAGWTMYGTVHSDQ